METIKYTSDEKRKGNIQCSYMELKKDGIVSPIYIGSITCCRCRFFKKVDLKNSFVICEYKKEKGKE